MRPSWVAPWVLVALAALPAAASAQSPTPCTTPADNAYVIDCGVGPLPGNHGVGFTVGHDCWNVRAQGFVIGFVLGTALAPLGWAQDFVVVGSDCPR